MVSPSMLYLSLASSLRSRASSSPAGSTACHSSPDHWLSHRSGKESRTYHSNLNINIFIYKVIFFQSVCQLFAPKPQFLIRQIFYHNLFFTANLFLFASNFSPPDLFWMKTYLVRLHLFHQIVLTIREKKLAYKDISANQK